MNPEKPEIIVLGAKSIVKQIKIHGVNLPGGHSIRFSTNTKNLLFIIDANVTFATQVNSIVTSCFKTLRNISKVKSYLPRNLWKTLITSHVISRLDTNNSLYYGIDSSLIKK